MLILSRCGLVDFGDDLVHTAASEPLRLGMDISHNPVHFIPLTCPVHLREAAKYSAFAGKSTAGNSILGVVTHVRRASPEVVRRAQSALDSRSD